MTMDDALRPAWRVHLGTAGITCLRLAVPSPAGRDPWPLSRVVATLAAEGAARVDRPHALGSGRGVPILHRQQMTWRGCDLHLEAQRLQSSAEVSLELPAWDELAESVAAEDMVWGLVDTVAEACDARWGAIGDGEALGDTPDLRRHPAVLVPEREADAFGITRPYAILHKSGLALLLR